MAKPRTRSTTAPSTTTIAKELRARLDADDDDEYATLRDEVALWDRIHPILAANDASKLLASEDLQATIDEVEQLLVNDKPVAVFNQKPFQDTEKGEDDSDYEVDGLPTIRPPTNRKTSVSPTPKASQKKKRVPSGLTESEASEDESSEAEPDAKPSDKTPKGSLYECSDDDEEEEEADSGTNDKADKEAAPTPSSSAGPKTPSPSEDKSSGKSHDKGRDKNPRKTP
ncbi:hypothetical protein PF008_g17832 [Phytophthora fragariae]|uniref:Uncharacterized protein n=3 Tax=Phytophthora fragariae TaxID=53985 RepID=A0A6G0R745_9STRA|nr:hypothetical protein PF008_g17832 [Phytophthora fragariae]